jgi:hypothetical protein
MIDMVKNAVNTLDAMVNENLNPAPEISSFTEFLEKHAKVRLNNGRYVPYSFEGRRPLIFCAELLSKIIQNTVRRQVVEIDERIYAPRELVGATVSICGGAQFGKTVLELNFSAYCTSIEFINFGYYTPDKELLNTIVDTKFRPDVVDQIEWLPEMIELNKAEGKSGKSVNKKNSYQISDGKRTAFGYFVGLQKPTTTISLDVAACDETDDIPKKNIGFVSGRMTNSDVKLTCYIGTQRIHGAGQNERFESGTQHKWTVTCPHCCMAICIEEHWPQVCRVSKTGAADCNDPQLSEEMTYDPSYLYYAACPDCGTPIDRDSGAYIPTRPDKAKQLNFSIRVSQMGVEAIDWESQVASWFAALQDPDGEALIAWHCDRRAIPHAGSAQPITPEVVQRCIDCGLKDSVEDETDRTYCMSMMPKQHPRVMGMDTGPRCWMWIDDIVSPVCTPMVWAEKVSSGRAEARVLELFYALDIDTVFIDAGGEPELTKSIVLKLNGLDSYSPPVVSFSDLKNMRLLDIGAGVTWDGDQGRWINIKAAAVLFSKSQGSGVQHDIGRTVDGQIYPLIKCNRYDAISAAVNDFGIPKDGVIEQIEIDGKVELRRMPRARLPKTYIGNGAEASVVHAHLTNLRKIKNSKTGVEDWAEGIENHLGLSKVYARIASQVVVNAPKVNPGRFHRFKQNRHTAARYARRSRSLIG